MSLSLLLMIRVIIRMARFHGIQKSLFHHSMTIFRAKINSAHFLEGINRILFMSPWKGDDIQFATYRDVKFPKTRLHRQGARWMGCSLPLGSDHN
jgi:hypothetical protein